MTVPVGHFRQDFESNIVSRPVILAARISKAHDQFHVAVPQDTGHPSVANPGPVDWFKSNSFSTKAGLKLVGLQMTAKMSSNKHNFNRNKLLVVLFFRFPSNHLGFGAIGRFGFFFVFNVDFGNALHDRGVGTRD